MTWPTQSSSIKDRPARSALRRRRLAERLPVAGDEVAQRGETGGLRHFVEAAVAAQHGQAGFLQTDLQILVRR